MTFVLDVVCLFVEIHFIKRGEWEQKERRMIVNQPEDSRRCFIYPLKGFIYWCKKKKNQIPLQFSHHSHSFEEGIIKNFCCLISHLNVLSSWEQHTKLVLFFLPHFLENWNIFLDHTPTLTFYWFSSSPFVTNASLSFLLDEPPFFLVVLFITQKSQSFPFDSFLFDKTQFLHIKWKFKHFPSSMIHSIIQFSHFQETTLIQWFNLIKTHSPNPLPFVPINSFIIHAPKTHLFVNAIVSHNLDFHISSTIFKSLWIINFLTTTWSEMMFASSFILGCSSLFLRWENPNAQTVSGSQSVF